eukprot:4151320-Prymnesium_polylepis.1
MRAAARRAVDARSFCVHVGRKRRSSAAARPSARPAFSMSATTDSRDSWNAAACASADLPLSCARSSAISSSLPSIRRASICAR